MMVKKFSVIGIAIILTSSLLIGITSALIKNDYFKSFDNTANEPNVIIKDKFLYYDGINITWFGTSCFQLKTSDLVIYIDPYRLTGDEEIADIVIATHDHYDHLSVKDIKLIADTRTTLYTPKPSQTDAYGTTVEELETLEVKEIYYTKPWDNIEINGITLDFVPAYTLSHLPEWNWTGVIIDFGNVRIYHAGDTNLINEMKQINCNIALVPILAGALMSPTEGAMAIEYLQELSDLKYAIPMHFTYPFEIFNTTVGDSSEAEEFKEIANCTVVILEPINPPITTITEGKETPGFSIISFFSLITICIITYKRRNRD